MNVISASSAARKMDDVASAGPLARAVFLKLDSESSGVGRDRVSMADARSQHQRCNLLGHPPTAVRFPLQRRLIGRRPAIMGVKSGYDRTSTQPGATRSKLRLRWLEASRALAETSRARASMAL